MVSLLDIYNTAKPIVAPDRVAAAQQHRIFFRPISGDNKSGPRKIAGYNIRRGDEL